MEVSTKYLELDNPFRPADFAGFAEGEDVVVLTHFSEKEKFISSFLVIFLMPAATLTCRLSRSLQFEEIVMVMFWPWKVWN